MRVLECAKADYSDISLLMPSSFAEVWLRIYTKDGMFHGLIQAAYRHILKSLVSSDHSAAPIVEEVKEQEEGFSPDVLAGPAAGEAGDPDLLPIKVWQPGSPTLGDGPSTPRMFARGASTGSIGSGSGLGVGAASAGAGAERRGRTVGKTPSFSDNQFTAVPPNFRGESPSRKPRSKRGRDVSDSWDGGRPRKSARLSDKGADAA